MPPRRVRAVRQMTLEDLNVLLISAHREHLAETYGSLQAARERYDMLIETGQYRRRGGQLPPFVWWATERGVPPELVVEDDLLIELGVPGEPYTNWGLAIAASEALDVKRWAWLAEAGLMRPEDREALAGRHPS